MGFLLRPRPKRHGLTGLRGPSSGLPSARKPKVMAKRASAPKHVIGAKAKTAKAKTTYRSRGFILGAQQAVPSARPIIGARPPAGPPVIGAKAVGKPRPPAGPPPFQLQPKAATRRPLRTRDQERLRTRDQELDRLFQELQGLLPDVHREQYFVKGLGRAWRKRTMELDINILRHHLAHTARLVADHRARQEAAATPTGLGGVMEDQGHPADREATANLPRPDLGAKDEAVAEQEERTRNQEPSSSSLGLPGAGGENQEPSSSSLGLPGAGEAPTGLGGAMEALCVRCEQALRGKACQLKIEGTFQDVCHPCFLKQLDMEDVE